MIKNKSRVSSILFSVVYWMVVAFYFIMVRYIGHGPYAPPDLHFSEVTGYGLVVGFAIGLLFGLIPLNNILLSRTRASFLSVVLLRTSCYVLFFLVTIFFASLYGNTLSFAKSYVLSSHGLIILLHLSMASFLYHFILQINKKFGPGVLLEYTFGRYFSPKEEERVFLFIDLKSSTHIAEALEHVTYSRMVQDCYAELTKPLIDYKAQVIQYVGDEVVVSWRMRGGFSMSSCHEFFYAFRQRLESKQEYFIKQYGVLPTFKAGVHCGKVTVAEVGEIKTEIAYHGDVLNTASRIQNLCNQYQKDLLISETVLRHLPERDHTRIAFVAEESLRGKETTTKIFTIAHPHNVTEILPGANSR